MKPADVDALLEVAGGFDGDPKALRKLVLELAVNGRLTSRVASDESATALLKRINERRTQLEATKALRRFKEPMGLRRDLPSLPQGWVWASFGDVVFNRDGERVPLEKSDREKRQGQYDYYGASGIIDSIDEYLFDAPLLLIGEDGANLINRSTPIAFIAAGKYWVNNHAHVLDGLSEDLLRYLAVFINATDLRPYVTGTAQPKMNQAKMNSIPVALPPAEEQCRIVTRVDELMALCDELEEKQTQQRKVRVSLNDACLDRLLAAATADEFAEHWGRIVENFDVLYDDADTIPKLKKAVMGLGCSGHFTQRRKWQPVSPSGLAAQRVKEFAGMMQGADGPTRANLPAFEAAISPTPLPPGWQRITLESATLCIIDCPHSTPKFVESGVWCIDTTCIAPFKIHWDRARQVSPDDYLVRIARLEPAAGDVLFSREGTIGTAVVVPPSTKLCLGQRMMLFRFPSFVLPAFAELFLQSATFVGRYSPFVMGTAAKHLNIKALRRLAFDLPPVDEQAEIVRRVGVVLMQIDDLARRMEARRRVQTALASALPSAAPRPSPEPEEVAA